jgi:hypothetical protein
MHAAKQQQKPKKTVEPSYLNPFAIGASKDLNCTPSNPGQQQLCKMSTLWFPLSDELGKGF